MRRLKLRNLTICLCMICVVAFWVATPIVRVSALAQEITPELEPVYDTEVVSLQDYVNNVLTDAQVAVFNTILGSYVASQAGLNEYDLEYPYTDRSGVIGWLQDAGMKLYNAIITGGSFDLVTGTDLRTYIVTAASYAVGMAQKAHSYTDMNDFLNDVDNSTHYFIPIDPILQASINSYFGRSYGLWNWQFDADTFVSEDFVWRQLPLGDHQSDWLTLASSLNHPYVHVNRYDNVNGNKYYNMVFSQPTSYTPALFFRSDGYFQLVDDNTGLAPEKAFDQGVVAIFRGSYNEFYRVENTGYWNNNINGYVNYSSYNSISDAIKYVYNHQIHGVDYKLDDFVKHVYYGDSWNTRDEIYYIKDLNFAQNESPSYNQVPDNSYIDLKGFLTDILNNTNILNVILNNLFKPDGTLNVDPALIKVSITIPDTNPLPVNLNDVSEIIDNTYLDLVKQRATQASETIGEYVAFWHNCDPEVVYVSLGAILIIAIGAFIGKWGHS